MLPTIVVMQLLAQWPVTDCGLEPPGTQTTAPVAHKLFELPARPGEPPLIRRELPTRASINSLPAPRLLSTGALTGKTIYFSPGHGFTYEPDAPGWRTQRGQTNTLNQDLQIVEDLISEETVSQFILPMLMNAGARVVSLRESDLNTNLVVIDNGGAGYAESGTGFSDSSTMGWGVPPSPMLGDTQPFTLGTNRLMPAGAASTNAASYTATLPADGNYNVYVSYSSFSARATDAHYVVKHAGGESHFRVNQQRGGSTWQLLGRFYFKRAQPAVVQVLSDSTNTQSPLNVSLDAVRFGGGMGLTDRGGGVSGRPRAEESARYHTQYAGAPPSVFQSSSVDRTADVSARSRFAAWAHEPGEDAVYLAWHTNAFTGTAVGTDLYVYGPNPADGNYNFTGAPGSDTLAQSIHAEIINDLRAPTGWNRPTWRDRGIHSAYFGEINPAYNSEMPSVLMEIAFHDNLSDAAELKEPGFRFHVARAITQGLIKWFNAKDGVPIVLPPEAPTHVAAAVTGSDVRVSWHAPTVDTDGVSGGAATSYRVSTSADGLGWDDGVAASSTSFVAPISALTYFRVSAVNAGGESFPSDIVAARPGSGARVLVVNGFDRLDSSLMKKEDLTHYTLAQVYRMYIDRMNDGATVVRHADALDFAQVPFDSTSVQALAAGEASVTGAAAIDYAGGRGHPGDAGVSTVEQAAISATRRFVSGANFSSSSDPTFVSTALSATAGAPTSSLTITGSAEPLDGLPTLTLGDGVGAYWAGTNDTLTGAGVATYGGGGTAAVAANHQSVLLAFPFETIASRTQRLQVMGQVMKYLGVIGTIPVVPDAGPEPMPDGGLDPEPDAGMNPPSPITFDTLSDSYPAAPKGCGCHSVGWAGFAMAMLVIRRIGLRRHANQNRHQRVRSNRSLRSALGPSSKRS